MAPAELRFNKAKAWIYLSGMALAELRFNKAKQKQSIRLSETVQVELRFNETNAYI
jgi:hypothetical protein